MEILFSIIGGILNLIPVLLVFGFWAAVWYFTQVRRNKRAAARDASGRAVERTGMAKVGLGSMGGLESRIMSVGSNRAARSSLNVATMTPTLMARAIATLLPLAGMWLLMFTEVGTPLRDIPYLIEAGCVIGLYSIIVLNTYEVRYDRDSIITRNERFQRREFLWKDLTGIKDNGHSHFNLRFRDGTTYKMQKHLVGMTDFLTLAHQHIDANTNGA